MKLFRIKSGIIINYNDSFYFLKKDWDTLVNRNFLYEHLLSLTMESDKIMTDAARELLEQELLPPIGTQEVWAAGVTYLRSRDARMEESGKSGASDLYDRVYDADRPELFFKSLPHRVAGHHDDVYIRRDSSWNVPEPELTLAINSEGLIQGYTIGNDMSSRSIEGQNALYLPQAKIYERSAAVGPCLFVSQQPIPMNTGIRMVIWRDRNVAFEGMASIGKMKRRFYDLVSYLYRECVFENGCYLMTGTCLVPPDEFTLQEGDVIDISIDLIGQLSNTVKFNPASRLINHQY